jgi:AcrR family transcriptional regulator
MAQRGRRPGDQPTRAEVLAAARELFLEQGFNKTALTAVARRAAVDTSLIYHYFGTKVNLFIECLLGSPFPLSVEATPWAGRVADGREIVAAFLALWEREGDTPGQAFVAIAQAASGSVEAAQALQRFVANRIWTAVRLRESGGAAAVPIDEDIARRFSMIGSQLIGIAFARYVLRLEPLASAPADEVARLFGPTIDRYRAGELPPVKDISP